MQKTTSQLANEIRQMSIKARYSENPDEAKMCRILMTVFLRELLRHGQQGPHCEIAASLLSKNAKSCSPDQAKVLAKAAAKRKVGFGKLYGMRA